MAVEVQNADVFNPLKIPYYVSERLRITALDRVEIHLVGQELVDALVAQFLYEPLVGELGIRGKNQDRSGSGC
jgi:hypothetical protein